MTRRLRRYALIASQRTTTNRALATAGGKGWRIVAPLDALGVLNAGDVAIGRLDVLQTLDGVADGLWVLGALEARGVTVLNGAGAMLAAHDKLLTSRLLGRAGLPHPRTLLHRYRDRLPHVTGTVVVKPRFGSWGRDVARCETKHELAGHLASLCDRDWFRRHGALVQPLVPPRGYDLRVIVAGGQVAGAVIRVAPDGEWRTNVALGAQRVPTTAPPEAARLAIAAATAIGADLVGVDLLPTPGGGWTILELNGAVDFTPDYRLDGDVFESVAAVVTERAAARDRASTEPVLAGLNVVG